MQVFELNFLVCQPAANDIGVAITGLLCGCAVVEKVEPVWFPISFEIFEDDFSLALRVGTGDLAAMFVTNDAVKSEFLRVCRCADKICFSSDSGFAGQGPGEAGKGHIALVNLRERCAVLNLYSDPVIAVATDSDQSRQQ